MDFKELLVRDADQIITDSFERLRRAHLPHYSIDGEESLLRRLTKLYELLQRVVVERNPDAIAEYAENVARERYTAGYDLCEVQSAINAMEEVLWQNIAAAMRNEDFAAALGLTLKIMSTTKDELARAWVVLACQTHLPTLDLRGMLKPRS